MPTREDFEEKKNELAERLRSHTRMGPTLVPQKGFSGYLYENRRCRAIITGFTGVDKLFVTFEIKNTGEFVKRPCQR